MFRFKEASVKLGGVVAALLVLISLAGPVTAQLLLDDPLQGSTNGTRGGGTFANGGWQVTGTEDYIFWHLPYSVSHGAAEYYIKGVNPSQPEKNEWFHMYDYSYNNSDYSYSPGYRENPYKMFMRRSGVNDGAKSGSFEVICKTSLAELDQDTPALSWAPGTNYKMRVEWGPDGAQTRFRIFRDGGEILNSAVDGVYAPAGHSVRIAKCRGMGEGAQINAVYSYLKVWDLTNNIPGAPTVTGPANGSTQKSNLAFIKWSGESHTQYQVRVCSADDPNTGIVWDSGQVSSSRDWAWTGALGDMGSYYVFVRVGSGSGWSPWSAGGYSFRVDSTHSGANNVLMQGNSLADNNGPFLGLGFTYMRSLQRCKYDRSRFQSDIAAMAGKGFNYQRILSMVSWTGMEIAPISFSGVPAWSDYWSQFDYDIDYAYDNYGVRTEVTIFADAQICMPNDSDRYAHMDTILAHCNARSEKIVQIEVANEGFKNGFPDETVTRSFCQYLAARTSIPVSITSPLDGSDTGIQSLYGNGPADIATVHLSRDLGGISGHWEPVIDCWRLANLYPGVPPVSSNEPIGSGSSVATEDHPIHLCSAGAFAWIANLPMYVYHSKAGTSGVDAGGNPVGFEQTAGFDAYQYLRSIIPPDAASWIRNDGIESAAPFTVYCNGQANKYWTDVPGASTGCHRNIGGRKGIEFICFTHGVLGGGVKLEARQQTTFKVYNALTGAVVMDVTTKNAGQQINLPGSAEAYIIKGAYGPSLPGQVSKTLVSKGPRTISIDGDSADWNLSEYTTMVRGGRTGSGDTALVGFDGSACYYGSYTGVLPTNAADHTAKIYSRNDASYLYFLVRCDDDDMRYGSPTSSNWANDCVEFYIDPGHDRGGTAMSSSTSDIQLVIDANNQKSVYMTTTGYATQILDGVTSAVVRDGTGWWLEARITKTALDPDTAVGDTVGLDFNFRDNDNNNDAALTTVYTWNDSSYQGFPSKIPNNWGDCFLDANQTPYAGVIAIPGLIQAENYDVGGRNISYYDTTPGNISAQYRADDVDIDPTSDIGGGYSIGYAAQGEWLEYTVNVATTGDYSIRARVATPYPSASLKVLLDGADLTGVRSFASTGGWQNWTTVIVPARPMTAGQHILRFSFETGDYNLNSLEVASNGVDAVSVDLGSPDAEDGISHISTGDGDTVPWTIGGHVCRENASASDGFMYFNVADAFAFQGSKPNLYITIDYYDLGTGVIGLNYDAIASPWTTQVGPTLSNTLTWKSYTFHITDAYFGNRENYGADFRVYGPAGGAEFAIDTVCAYPPPPDAVPPGNVTGFAATAADLANNLFWTNPSDPDLTGVKIMFKTTGYPTGPTDGTLAYDGPGTSATHTGLTNGTTYYYKAFAHDGSPNYAPGVQGSATPVDAGPPANVTGFAAASGNTQVVLSWTNPTIGFTGVKIMFKTTGYPTWTNDGTQVYNGSGTTYTHTGLTNGIVYYYKAFAHDEIPNYASGAPAATTPAGPTALSISSFDADNNGWNISLWNTSGNPASSQAQMGFTSGAGNPGGAMRCIGGGVTDNNDKCLREGGDASKVISTVGYHDIRVDYSLRVNNLGGDWTGAGIGGNCPPDHGVIDEQLTVYYSTNGGTSWTEADYVARAGLLGYQSYGTRSIDLTGVTGANENANFALRFRWQLNCQTDTADLDNIVVLGMSDADTTPPGPLTGLIVTPSDGHNAVVWSNPPNPDFVGTMIRCKTTGYPTSVTDGALVCNKTAAPGSPDAYNHAGLTNGVRYYYSAFAYDGVPNYSGATNAAAMPAADSTIPAAKGLADGQACALRGNIVSAVFSDGFYIQDPLHPYGIKVTGQTATQGQKVDVIGVIRGQASERYIDCAGNPVTVTTHPSPAALRVASLANLALGGASLNAYAPGALNAHGPNNLGLLVCTWGKVTQRDRSLQFFYIDDGSGRSDGTQTEIAVGVWEPSVGVRVKADPTTYPKDSYLAVTGVSSCFSDGGVLKAMLLPRGGGIQTLR
jgi:hypothetical protein